MEFIYKNYKGIKENNELFIYKNNECIVWMFLEENNGKLNVVELNNGYEYSVFGYDNIEKYVNKEIGFDISEFEELKNFDKWEDIVVDFVKFLDM